MLQSQLYSLFFYLQNQDGFAVRKKKKKKKVWCHLLKSFLFPVPSAMVTQLASPLSYCSSPHADTPMSAQRKVRDPTAAFSMRRELAINHTILMLHATWKHRKTFVFSPEGSSYASCCGEYRGPDFQECLPAVLPGINCPCVVNWLVA